MIGRHYSRFVNTFLIIDGDKERNYLRERLDTTPREDDFFYTVKYGDRIDLLAYRFYGSPDLWWVIADYNDLRFPLVLEVGTVLRCPSYDHLFMDLLEG